MRVVAANVDAIERERRLPDAVVDALRASGPHFSDAPWPSLAPPRAGREVVDPPYLT